MFHYSSRSFVRYLLLSLMLTTMPLTASPQDPTSPSQSDRQPQTDSRQQPASASPPNIRASSQPSIKGGHQADTDVGRTPHSSGNGAAIAAGTLGGVGAGVLIGELIAHNKASPEHFGHGGPEIPKQFDMNGFVVKGIASPGWPIVLDFTIDSPGLVRIDIFAANKQHVAFTLTNTPNQRAYGIFHLPPDFGTKLQTAIFQVRSMPAAGANTPAPALRTYGMGCGERAVGSVAIDQLSFQPATIHPKAKEVATYGFHSHSAFDGVREEFIFTTLYNGHILVQQDQEENNPSTVGEGERAKGTWEGKGKAGEHMLQVRAWRGLENGGDWVVAWSPDIVDVVK